MFNLRVLTARAEYSRIIGIYLSASSRKKDEGTRQEGRIKRVWLS